MTPSEKPFNREHQKNVANRKRVIRKTLTGIGTATAIAGVVGFSIGFAVTLAQNGLNPNSIKYAFAIGKKNDGVSAVSAAGVAVTVVTVSRAITDRAAAQKIAYLAVDLSRPLIV